MTAPPPPAGCSAAETEALIHRALETKKAADLATKGCRKMRPREYNTYLALAGLPENTTREDAPMFVVEWETTVSNEASMRTLVNLLVARTKSKLGLLNFVTYYPSRFIKDIQTMAFGLHTDNTWI